MRWSAQVCKKQWKNSSGLKTISIRPAIKGQWPPRKKGIMKTREDRREELKRFAAGPNGINKLYLILTQHFIPFEKLPLETLIIEAILDHEYPPTAGQSPQVSSASV